MILWFSPLPLCNMWSIWFFVVSCHCLSTFSPFSLTCNTCYILYPLFHPYIMWLPLLLPIHFLYLFTCTLPLTICMSHMCPRLSFIWFIFHSFVFPTLVYIYCRTLYWYDSKSLVNCSSKVYTFQLLAPCNLNHFPLVFLSCSYNKLVLTFSSYLSSL